MNCLKQRIESHLAAIKTADHYRRHQVFSSVSGAYCDRGLGQEINFASSDYLGLSQAPDVIDAGCRALKKTGAGTASSVVVQGYREAHMALEVFLKEKLNRSDVLYFPNAFTANQSVLRALLHPNDWVYLHRDNHASLNEFFLKQHRYLKRFEDPDLLDHATQRQTSIKLVKTGQTWLISDHIFSVTGRVAPIEHYIAFAKKKDVFLWIDDVHGLGVWGKQGLGLAESFSEKEVPLITLGFGKAIGCYGGALVGDTSLIDYIRQTSRASIYSVAPPSVLPTMILAALRENLVSPWRRIRLNQAIDYFITLSKHYEIPWVVLDRTPIFALVYDSVIKARMAQAALQAKKIYVTLMRYPSVSYGQACLRISLTCHHTTEMIDQLLLTLADFSVKKFT